MITSAVGLQKRRERLCLCNHVDIAEEARNYLQVERVRQVFGVDDGLVPRARAAQREVADAQRAEEDGELAARGAEVLVAECARR